MPRLSIEKRIRIVEGIKDGKSQRAIAKIEKINQCTVRKLWIKYMDTGSVFDRVKSGRPRKTSVRDERLLCILSKKSPFKCAPDLHKDACLEGKCSISTVKRILIKYGLRGRIAAKKPLLTRKHIKARLQWCRQYQCFSIDQWKNVIFSDESRVQLLPRNQTRVRRLPNCRYSPSYTQGTLKYGGLTIMVWGAIKGDGSRYLMKCPDRLDSIKYQLLLTKGLRKLYNYDNIFMQDGAPCHKSKSTLDFLDGRNICVLADWPAQSPDLNIIENLWSILKARIRKRIITNIDQLWECAQQEFYAIDNKIIIDLFESIPRRLQRIISNKGYPCKY